MSRRVAYRLRDTIQEVGLLHEALTSRELAVLTCMANGLTTRATGEHLFIGEETVKSHLKAARQKLGATNTTHAVAKLLRVVAASEPKLRKPDDESKYDGYLADEAEARS
jgi:DNA-binding CsgD family transcriptional regulator